MTLDQETKWAYSTTLPSPHTTCDTFIHAKVWHRYEGTEMCIISDKQQS